MLFSNYFDARAADQCVPMRGSSAPAAKFPPSMRRGLAPELASLLDWEYPTPSRCTLLARVACL
jgi:hypothetical protein